MKFALQLPPNAPAMAPLTRNRPLPLLPLLGRTILDLQLEQLKSEGVAEVILLASDRPQVIEEYVSKGERWGIAISVRPLAAEETAAAAAAALGAQLRNPESLFPAYPHDPAAFFSILQRKMESTELNRIGMREIAPGIRVHTTAKVSPEAQLEAPCWIGENARVAAHAIVSGSSVESGAFVEECAIVSRSWIGPRTYVGAHTELMESLASEHILVKWPTGSAVEIVDEFLLSAVRQSPGSIVESPVVTLALKPVRVFWRAITRVIHRLRGTGNEDHKHRSLPSY